MSVIPAEQAHVYHYAIDAEGGWTCEGNPIVDDRLKAALSRTLFEAEGGYYLRCEGEIHPVRVSDAPLFVADVAAQADNGQLHGLELILTDGRRRPLTDNLTVGRDSRLYVRLGDKGLKAKFLRRAHLGLTAWLAEDQDGYHIPVNGRRYVIRLEEGSL